MFRRGWSMERRPGLRPFLPLMGRLLHTYNAMRCWFHHNTPQALATDKDQRHEPNCNELH
jgi:hypothetical protein